MAVLVDGNTVVGWRQSGEAVWVDGSPVVRWWWCGWMGPVSLVDEGSIDGWD